MLRTLCIAAATGLGAGASWPASFMLDDTGSYPLEATQQMRWRSLQPGRGTTHEVESTVRVMVRIDTRAWMGRQGRIYMVLPLDNGPVMTAQWTTQGKLMAGRLLSGDRTLVYSGPISTLLLEDQLNMTLRTDGRWNVPSRRLSFYFELDTD